MRARPTTPLVVVLASATPELSVAMKGADEHCIRARWPRVTVIVGTESADAGARRLGEQTRVAVADVMNAPRPLLAAIIGQVEGDGRLAVAAALPVFRQLVAETIVDETAKANASFAVTTGLAETIPVLTAPLNLGDMVVLTKNQLLLIFKIAAIHGEDIHDSTRIFREMVPVVGAGFFWRTVAREAAAMVPMMGGAVPKVAIAYTGTMAIGRAADFYYTTGAKPSKEMMKSFYQQAAESLSKRQWLLRRNPKETETTFRVLEDDES